MQNERCCWLYMRYTLVVLCAGLIGCRAPSHVPVLRIPVAESDYMGDWIGLSLKDTFCFLLVLNPDHDGSFFSEMPSGAIRSYRIRRWILTGNQLRCDFETGSIDNSPLTLECKIQIRQLVGCLLGRDGWTENVVFKQATN